MTPLKRSIRVGPSPEAFVVNAWFRLPRAEWPELPFWLSTLGLACGAGPTCPHLSLAGLLPIEWQKWWVTPADVLQGILKHFEEELFSVRSGVTGLCH